MSQSHHPITLRLKVVPAKPRGRRRLPWAVALTIGAWLLADPACGQDAAKRPLSKVRIAADHHGFVTADGKPFFPWGVNYYRPDTGWAPQVWKQFDPQATRRDFARMKALGVNCVRVFLSYGSFLMEPDRVRKEGLEKFDEFLSIAESAGIYVHPTGPDAWEGLPGWACGDRIADEQVLRAKEVFWREFARRYRGRAVIFAYDLRNEPAVAWDTPVMKTKWNAWIQSRFATADKAAQAWGVAAATISWGNQEPPPARNSADNRLLLDYQHFRESVAVEWTRRQAEAIKAADSNALVTVGLIQSSIAALMPGVQHYAAFRPKQIAPFLDFLEIHYYPLESGFYEYADRQGEQQNLACLESAVREVAATEKPVVVAEFGWYGGGKLTFDQGRHAAATEEQQAQWCCNVVQTTRSLAVGWLNWGLFDEPTAKDCSQLSGLLTHDGKTKAWGRDFQRLGSSLPTRSSASLTMGPRPAMDWDRCVTSTDACRQFREAYFKAYLAEHGGDKPRTHGN